MNDKELVSEDGKMFKPNDKDSLISIVIPIYNAEKYLEECLNSIKNQTYKNIEVIMVNDGSKDDSETICKRFSEYDARFRYFTKANGGVSSARNLGLDNVKGDYITFIDADDWIDEKHLELLITTVKKNHSDIVISSYKQFNNIDVFYLRAYTIQEKYLLNFERMNRDDFLTIFPKLMSTNVCFNNAVAKLFRKELVNDLRFDTSIKYGEDLDFYFRLYLNVDSISYVDEPTYVYRMHGDSTTSNFNQEHAEQELSIFKQMYEKIQEIGLPSIHYFNKLKKLLELRMDFLENKVLLNEWVELYGEDSDFVKIRVRGVFPSASDTQFISASIVDEAQKRVYKVGQFDNLPTIIGVDPAWTGGDTLEIVMRNGYHMKCLATIEKNDDDMRMANLIAQFEDEYKADAVFIDQGYGTGIYSIGKSMGRKWRLVAFGGKSPNDMYLNMRAYMWGEMKEWLKEGGSIPNEQGLYDDLVGPEAIIDKNGRIQLESKKDMKERGLPSPNKGDALALTFAFRVTKKVNGNHRRVANTEYKPFG